MFPALKNFSQNLRNKLPSANFKIPNFSLIIILLVIFSLGIGTGYKFFGQNKNQILQNQVQKDPYISFLGEIYDKIKENYWDTISDEQLVNLYKQSAEKITGRPQKVVTISKPQPSNPNQAQVPSGNSANLSLDLQGSSISDLKILNQENQKPEANQKQALEQMLKNILKDLDDSKKKEFAKTLAAAVLANLSPNARSGLFTQKQETQLKNTVQNINPEKDLYKDLGLAKGASSEAVQQAYQTKAEELKKENTPQAQEKLKQLSYNKDVLTDTDKKKNYDAAGIEPTTASRLVTPDIAYLKFVKFSPTTYEEFVKIVNSYDKANGPKALIFDLRGNIGGAIDALPFFLGNFLGDKQYAYEFLHKGEYETFKTLGAKLPGLTRLKQIVVLIDNQTQSSAELMASALKRYHFGVLVGEATKGWGTVEKVFPLNSQFDQGEKYSLLLVHSITIRNDGQPIEGRGVEPDINIKDPNWEQKLFEYFRYPELIEAIKKVT